MFTFGRPKNTDPKVEPNPISDAVKNAHPSVPPEAQEALAIGGGKGKAAAEAIENARNKLSELNATLADISLEETGGGALSGGKARTNAATSGQKASSMTNPSSQTKTSNGNGADAANGDGVKGKADGSPFTEPTPGGKEKTVSQLFGEIVWLFSQSPKHKNFFVSDLEWLVMTPVLLRQFRVFYAPDRPIGVALWAYVNDEVEQRLMSGNARLAPQDWKSGEKLWLVDIVAPYGGHDAMIKDLKEKVFPDSELKYLGVQNGIPTTRLL